MIFGLTTQTYTIVHVAISLVAIATGLIVLLGLLRSQRMDRVTGIFLFFTAATNLTGFGFPIAGRTPALVLGAISTVVLLIALAARYVFAMRGVWRPTYAVAAVSVLYFNVFVLIVQSFQKIAALHALAPAGSEPPFAVAQGAVLLLFVVSGVTAVLRFRPAA